MYLLAKQVLQQIDDNFIGIFLYGSQNYGLDNESSDKDAILILKNAPQKKKQIQLKEGLIKIYTLEYFISRLRRGDMECYEILYTHYRFVNEKYEKIFDKFVEEFSNVINIERIKNSLLIKLREHRTCIMWLTSNHEKAKYHRKRVYWSYRVLEQFKQLEQGKLLSDTFEYPLEKKEQLINIKNITNYLSLKELSTKIAEIQQVLNNAQKYDVSINPLENKILIDFYNQFNI